MSFSLRKVIDKEATLHTKKRCFFAYIRNASQQGFTKKVRKILAAVLAAVMLVTALPLTALAANVNKDDAVDASDLTKLARHVGGIEVNA